MGEFSILIIDDEESQLKSLSSFLKRRKYSVFTASSGPEGYKIAQDNQLDLVFTDFRMPEWDGITVVNKLSKTES